MAKNISLYKPNIPVIRNIYGVQISGFMPEELEQIKDAASQKASKEKAITEKKRKELEQKKAEEDRIRKANEAWVKNIKDQIAKAKSEGVDTSELEKRLDEYIKKTKGPNIEPIAQQESVNIATPEESNNNNISVAPQSKRAESVTTEDPYHSDPVEESIPLTKLSFKGTVIDGVQASETTKPAGIASLETMEQVANMRGKLLSQELEDKESKTKNRATTEDVDSLTKATKGANAINAINAAVGLGLGIYGAHQINKMQRPSMVSAPQIEAAKIRDTGAQMMTARKGMIEQSANTSREALRRAGRSDLNATITSGETRALNEAAGSIEGMRANINAANVAAENRVREINATTKMQADQFNSQLQASFNQFRSQLGSQNLSTTVQNVSANLGGIAQNNYAQALRKRDEDLQLRIAKINALK